MRKFIFVTIMMVVCVNGMLAQTTDEINDSTVVSDEPELVDNFTPVGESETKPQKQVNSDGTNMEDMAKLWAAFQKFAVDAQNEERPIATHVPVSGKTKFTRRHYIGQRLEISVIGGTDGADEEGSEMKSTYQSQDDVDDAQQPKQFNWGLNFGYSLFMVPGSIEGDQLRLNKLGLGYSLGLIASFDKQDRYGTTCDFLAKLGFEAGNGHAMGIGIDFLVGTGKSAGDYNFTARVEADGDVPEHDEDYTIPYTKWCFKYGTQLWIRSNLLQAKVKNTDVRLFARYVYSVNPENEDELLREGIDCDWRTESWSFGLTFCYNF